MKNTLENKSTIWREKSKFFIFRTLIYFSFLLIPIAIPKLLAVPTSVVALVLIFYICFLCGQWFLLGKEIDYRLNIYYRINSSLDRIIYRIFLGMSVFLIYFYLLSFLPSKWIYNIYWITWVTLGLFYSWPTRGKIIRESMTTNFTEFKYLDSFEKTLLLLTIVIYLLSFPNLSSFGNEAALKLYFDPAQTHSSLFWRFMIVTFYPFKKYPELLKVAWNLHYYLVGMGGFLFILYVFLRYFVSRRLSLLGVFALLSSWSYTKLIVDGGVGLSFIYSYALLTIWALFWISKSSTYRSGLLAGVVGFWGVNLHSSFLYLYLGIMVLIYTVTLSDKNRWFRHQFLKYTLWGNFWILWVLFFGDLHFEWSPVTVKFLIATKEVLTRKAFHILAFFGIALSGLTLYDQNHRWLRGFKLDHAKLHWLLMALTILLFFGLFANTMVIAGFSLLWPATFLALLPLELIFQTISRLRSSRNLIFLIYILICLLDSHIEGRVKIFLRLFE